jgi:hypothetical protein
MAKDSKLTETLVTGDAVTFQNAVTQTLYHKVTELLDARKQEIARDVLVGEENLEELSKETLGSYIKKASSDAVGHAFDFGDKTHKAANSTSMKEKGELQKAATKHGLKTIKRQIGISKAADRVTNPPNMETSGSNYQPHSWQKRK